MPAKSVSVLSLIATALAAQTGLAASNPSPARTQNFPSPNGVQEQCVALAQIPGGKYQDKDADQEDFFCSINLYDPEVALCPKFLSTSPGTYIYSNEGTNLTPQQFEANRCDEGKSAGGDEEKASKLAKFKNTMNANGTSGTYSWSSLLYYHFSRYFNMDVRVPVAVYRTIDKQVHFDRVSSKSDGKGKSKMNVAGWLTMKAAETNPASYTPTSDLFTDGNKQIYGIMLKNRGKLRYGPEFNGTRAGGWGDGQNRSFQNTPGFLALRSEKPLADAITEGLAGAVKDPAMKTALGSAPVSKEQMVFWMKELTDITLLDYIFSQQDRIGNINFSWSWYYTDGGKIKFKDDKDHDKVMRPKIATITPPDKIADLKPILLQRSSIDDNDAGGMLRYANFTKRTQMLEKIRHYSADTYRRLLALNKDLKAGGPVAQWMKASLRLNDKEVNQIKVNTAAAAQLLQQTCAAGKLQFDLDPAAYLAGKATVEKVDCNNP